MPVELPSTFGNSAYAVGLRMWGSGRLALKPLIVGTEERTSSHRGGLFGCLSLTVEGPSPASSGRLVDGGVPGADGRMVGCGSSDADSRE
jgi:hypothetical protein